MTTWLSRLFAPRTDRLAPLRPLWARIVAIAREPSWYTKGGIADTVTGRFDSLTLVTALVMLRMERDPAMLAASSQLTELFVADVEGQLRQRGIGDPTLGKQMGKLIGTLSGRIGALREALAATADPAMLLGVVSRNVSLTEGTDPAHVAAELRVVAGQLAELSAAQVLAGDIER